MGDARDKDPFKALESQCIAGWRTRQAIKAGRWRRGITIYLASCIALGLLAFSPATMAVTPNHGDAIVNNVTVSSSVGNAAANVSVTAVVRTPSTIEFLQYAPAAAGAQSVPVALTECSTSGTGAGPFVPVPGPNDVSGAAIAVPANVDLLPVTLYKIGEPVFLRVSDADQNLNAAAAETILVSLSVPGLGDSELLRLTETGLDTGVFTGYIQSDNAAVGPNNCGLNTAGDETVSADYTDVVDGSDTAAASVLVDPFGMVFDSTTGAPVDNAEVTLIDVSTGLPATVYADDGTTAFPATVFTGSSFTVGGIPYSFPPGGFRFPFVNPGTYRLDVTPPSGYGFPSTVATSTLQALPGAPYAIVTGSRNEAFVVPVGPALHIDIPLDPAASGLFLTKTASKTGAAIGDFLQYKLKLENFDAAAMSAVVITDVLPKGFRYQAGSARVDGARFADPVIAADGRTLTFSVANIAANSRVELRYVVELTSGAQPGDATNTAAASATNGIGGTSVSNTASATVKVLEDLLRSRSYIMGRVLLDDCADGPPVKGAPGVTGVRLYLEDGTYVVTDEKGMYHFEGVRPGTHVVQIDTETVPRTMEVIECEHNTRVAGSPHSRFVDLKGGTMWRADFTLRQSQRVSASVRLRLQSEFKGATLNYTVTVRGATPSQRNLEIVLPEGIGYQNGSSVLDGAAIADPVIAHKRLSYTLGAHTGPDKPQSLRFRAVIRKGEPGEYRTQAQLVLDSHDEKPRRSVLVENAFRRLPTNQRRFEVQGHYQTVGTELGEQDRRRLDAIVASHSGKRVWNIEVVAHTDSSPISAGDRHRFPDNYALSRARAGVVAEYLRDALALDPKAMEAVGKGSEAPIADNTTAAGRMRNQRVEVFVRVLELHESPVVVLNEDSEVEETFMAAASQSMGADSASAATEGSTTLGILSLKDGERISSRVGSIRLRLAPGLQPRLFLDGKAVSDKRIGLRMREPDSGTVLYAYIGVDLGAPGVHTLTLMGVDPFGNARYEQELNIVRTGEIADIKLVADDGNVADGHTPITVRLQLLDYDGEPIAAAAELELKGGNLVPYHKQPLLPELKQTVTTVKVDADGLVRFAPTGRSGPYTAVLGYHNVSRAIKVYVKPESREWIMVGLAEGTVGHRTLSGNMQQLQQADLDDDYYQDGRLAFFAKGKVKGEWLLTIAYDSARERGELGNNLHQVIDPNAFYTLYGDATQQQYDAASTEKLYLRLEREQAYLMFGDYDTGLTVTELSRYSRSLTGLKAQYEGRHFSVNAFASETEQAFIKDEIRGDGTSGLYRLSHRDILVNSDKVLIEVRDRFHSERVLSTRVLARHIDYTIDTVAGALYFKEPVYSQDEAFNPVYIVVDYEVMDSEEREITAGGRAAVKTVDERFELGATAIHEGTEGAEGDLYGADARIALDRNTEIRAEIATSEDNSGGLERSGDAYLAELTHQGRRVQAKAYVREQEEGFGLGQQKGSETGTRKAGIDARYRHEDHVTLRAETWREENLATEATREVANAELIYREDKYSLSGGLRYARDEDAAGVEQDSELVTAGASRSLFEDRLKLRADAEVAVGDDANPDFPTRYILGLDYGISPAVELFLEQELTEGDKQDSASTRVGLRSSPWRRATLNTSVENQSSEFGPRTFATLGLTQGVQLNKNLSLDFGLDRSATVRDPGDTPFNVNVPPASGTVDNDFTAASMGATYREELWSSTGRVEVRDADKEDKLSFLFGFYRQQTPGFGMSTSVQYFDTEYTNGSEATNANLRFSLAYRPIESRWIVLNRTDLTYDKTAGNADNTRTRKFVNNVNANYLLDRRNQIALQYGVKYALDSFDEEDYRGLTHLFGTEYRHDLTRRWDLGVHASGLYSVNADNHDHSWGVSSGFAVTKNMWLSVGYNFDGFSDRDFSAADYTAKGAYIKFRLSLDQRSSRAALAWWEKGRKGNAD